MKKIKISELTDYYGGAIDQKTVCGIAIGISIVIPNPFSIAGALAACLMGDK
jgi:hypothetical protein